MPKASVDFIHLGRRISKTSWPVYIGLKQEDVFSLKRAAKHAVLHAAKKIKERVKARRKK